MKKLFFILTLLIVVLSFMVIPGAHARQFNPTILTTNGLTWKGGDVYGFGAAWQLTDAPLVTGDDGATPFWHRRIHASDLSENNDRSELEIGEEKVKAFTFDPFCSREFAQDELLLYENAVDTNGGTYDKCYAVGIDVPSSLKNTNMRFRVNTYFDGGCSCQKALFDFYDSDQGNNTHKQDNISFVDPEYAQYEYAETYSGAQPTGSDHRFWGVHVTQNDWVDGNGNFNPQTQSPYGDHISGCFSGGSGGCPTGHSLPPTNGTLEWYWEDGHYPANVTDGGILDICFYGTYGSYPWCTLGL